MVFMGQEFGDRRNFHFKFYLGTDSSLQEGYYCDPEAHIKEDINTSKVFAWSEALLMFRKKNPMVLDHPATYSGQYFVSPIYVAPGGMGITQNVNTRYRIELSSADDDYYVAGEQRGACNSGQDYGLWDAIPFPRIGAVVIVANQQ
eukprot:m51a1_g11559 hypothetical protein (146) ;mRNA; r:230-742